MAPRLVAFVLAVWASSANAVAQTPYGGVTPVPRTTDPAAMRALGNDREVVERIRRGMAAEARRDWSAAAAEFERAIALHPAEPQGSTAYYDLGLARAGSDDNEAAAQAFREAILRDPGFLAARANLVTVLLRSGDLPAARTAADDLVAASPDSARALYARGIIALRAGDAVTALADFQALRANDPTYAVAYYNIAVADQQLGRYAEAESELRRALALAPGYVRARLALGAVLLHAGKRDEARLAFDEVARQTPDVALRNLAESLRDSLPH